MAAIEVLDPIVDSNWRRVYGVFTVDSDADHVVNTDATWEVEERLEEIFPNPDEVARLEFIRDDHRVGVVAVSATGQALAHITSALLGYDGSGPRLSQAICSFFGIPDSSFKQMQRTTWNTMPYVVVVFRSSAKAWSWERTR